MPADSVQKFAGADSAGIFIVAAVIQNAHNQVLLVRKRGSQRYIQPGGKLEADEKDIVALARELQEELGVIVQQAEYLGSFEDQAVHEVGQRVKAQVYQVSIVGEPRPQAEIAELRWVGLNDLDDERIAPLSRRHILPKVFGVSRT